MADIPVSTLGHSARESRAEAIHAVAQMRRSGYVQAHRPEVEAGCHRLMLAGWHLRQAVKAARRLGDDDVARVLSVQVQMVETDAARFRHYLGANRHRAVR